MRISIRRCLSMLRNTSDGNELALPLPMPSKEHSVGWLGTVVAGLQGRPGYYLLAVALLAMACSLPSTTVSVVAGIMMHIDTT